MKLQKAIHFRTQTLLVDMNIAVSVTYDPDSIPIFGPRFDGYARFLGTLR